MAEKALSNPFLAGLRDESEGEKKRKRPHPSNYSAHYYAKIAEILATHDQLFWPTLYNLFSKLMPLELEL